jgi:DNA-directed RNA polymerase subunit E'/Rpb7
MTHKKSEGKLHQNIIEHKSYDRNGMKNYYDIAVNRFSIFHNRIFYAFLMKFIECKAKKKFRTKDSLRVKVGSVEATASEKVRCFGTTKEPKINAIVYLV